MKDNFFKRIWLVLLSVGPGIFCIGYTIGTGSVTSMIKAGSQFGMQLLWVLALSCLFAWVLMEAYGRYAVVTGNTSIHSFRTHFRFGKSLAILVIVGIVFGQWNSLAGILGLSANALYETYRLFFPSATPENYWAVLGIACALIIILYGLLLNGNYSFFEGILVFFVTLMGVCFIISMFLTLPDPDEIIKGFIPRIPEVKGGRMLVAAFVGTTMAAPTFVVRPLLMKGKGWGKDDLKAQSKDAFISGLLMFLISASIMAAATGAMFYEGKVVDKVLDMVYTLEPIAGKFAVALFLVGALSAGLSSVFPALMVLPLLVADYESGELDMKSQRFRILTAVASIVGLSIPILGANPIEAQILTQIFNVFILPVVIIAILILINQKRLMGDYRAGWMLNTGLIASLLFSVLISYNGIVAIAGYFD